MFFKGGQAWVRMHNGQIVKQNKWKYVEFIFIFCSTFMLKMVSEMSKRQKDLHWCFSFILLVIYLNAKPTNGQCCSWSLISRGESNFPQKYILHPFNSFSFISSFLQNKHCNFAGGEIQFQVCPKDINAFYLGMNIHGGKNEKLASS